MFFQIVCPNLRRYQKLLVSISIPLSCFNSSPFSKEINYKVDTKIMIKYYTVVPLAWHLIDPIEDLFSVMPNLTGRVLYADIMRSILSSINI